MEKEKLAVFIIQVRFQCEVLLLTWERLKATANIDGLREREGSITVWGAVQDMLNAAGNIGKAFWGQSGKLADERTAVRAYFLVDDTSPFKAVDMRNSFEHFDERIDRWWRESKTRTYMDMAIGHAILVSSPDPLDAFRILNLDTFVLTFWGDQFNLQEIANEAHRLLHVPWEKAAARIAELEN